MKKARNLVACAINDALYLVGARYLLARDVQVALAAYSVCIRGSIGNYRDYRDDPYLVRYCFGVARGLAAAKAVRGGGSRLFDLHVFLVFSRTLSGVSHSIARARFRSCVELPQTSTLYKPIWDGMDDVKDLMLGHSPGRLPDKYTRTPAETQ